AAKAPRPVTSGRSSRRLTERPMTLISGPYLGMPPFAPYCQPLKPGEIYEVDLEIWPMGLALPEGSRLTLAIQGKDFKRAAGPLRDPSATTRPIVRPNCLPAGTRFIPAGSINPIFCCPCCPSNRQSRLQCASRPD